MIIQGTSAPFGEGDRMGDEKNTYWDIKQPGISFNLGSGRIALYRATLEIMGYPEFYRFLFNPGKKTLTIQRCDIDDPGAHKLPRIIKRETCDVSSKDLVRLMYRSCRWNPDTTCRIPGVGYPGSFAVSFDLNEAYEINEK